VVIRIVVIAALTAGLAACGGEASTPKTAVSAGDWAARAGEACHRAEVAVAERGWPNGLEDLGEIASGTVKEVREEIAAIQKLPVPENADAIEPFLADLEELDPTLDALVGASNEQEAEDLARAATALESQISALEQSAERAGLKRCLDDDPLAVVDAIRAPVAAEQVIRQGSAFSQSAQTRREAIEHLKAYERHLAAVDPPRWAAKTLAAYRKAVGDLREGLAQGTYQGAARRMGTLGSRLVDELVVPPDS
jgi:hypothetical protein